jgi:glutaredoxin
MNKKIIFSTILFLLVSAAAIFILASEKKSPVADGTTVPPAPVGQIVLYYGSTCPHCKDVDTWLKTNNVQAKVPYQEKEVYEDKANAKELLSTAKVCGIKDEKLVGVPFLWTGSACLTGGPDIESFFEQKISEKVEPN